MARGGGGHCRQGCQAGAGERGSQVRQREPEAERT